MVHVHGMPHSDIKLLLTHACTRQHTCCVDAYMTALVGAVVTRGGVLQAQKGARHTQGKPVPLTLNPQVYLQRLTALAALQAAWSPICTLSTPDSTGRG